jgi:hypothetical protein
VGTPYSELGGPQAHRSRRPPANDWFGAICAFGEDRQEIGASRVSVDESLSICSALTGDQLGNLPARSPYREVLPSPLQMLTKPNVTI